MAQRSIAQHSAGSRRPWRLDGSNGRLPAGWLAAQAACSVRGQQCSGAQPRRARGRCNQTPGRRRRRRAHSHAPAKVQRRRRQRSSSRAPWRRCTDTKRAVSCWRLFLFPQVQHGHEAGVPGDVVGDRLLHAGAPGDQAVVRPGPGHLQVRCPGARAREKPAPSEQCASAGQSPFVRGAAG